MSAAKAPIIIWFRRDLRLADNPALHAAFEAAKTADAPLILLYIQDTELDNGSAKNVWLHHSLIALSADISKRGGALVYARGKPEQVLQSLTNDSGARAVFWNRRYTEYGRDLDTHIKASLKENGIEVHSFNGNLLTEPWEIQTKTGGFYKVFTPYWRAARAQMTVADVLAAPPTLSCFNLKSAAPKVTLDDLDLLPKRGWGQSIMAGWQPGEAGAHNRLHRFLDGPVGDYTEQRNMPANETGTSRLSPHLAHGEISPRQIWHACHNQPRNADKFLAEIGWREFAYVLLFNFPKLASQNFKAAFDDFEWDIDTQALERWQAGQTGYPFVDAGMRELWQTGWQHNRVRMVCASFLIKHLLQDWRSGEAWYWDTLLEADPASNAASWQWVAGSGADAAPYFRIFNPFSQGEKFDPNGDYVRKYVPELAKMPKKYIHRPWEAPDNILEYAGVRLGKTYPKPMVDHKTARERALSAYKESRE